jgi:hypothetical protein
MLLVVGWLLPDSTSAQGIKLTPAQRAMAHGELPLTTFYDTPVPLTTGKPGDLIRWQPFDEYDLPDGVSARRILYHSVAATGEDIAASGVVLIPGGDTPKGGWPIIAWAHPFIAVARPCAPSLRRDLGSGSVLSMYVNLGYAVVAPDYAGFGTDFRNAGFDLPSNGMDVINAVKAARKAVPQLGARWIAIGEGNGGASAISAAERQTQDGDYLGSVSISGTLDLKAAMDELTHGAWSDDLASFAYGIKTVYPAFRLEDMLAAKGLARYEVATPKCSSPALSPQLSATELLKADWAGTKFVQDFFRRNTLGLKPANVPVLIISAENSKNSVDARMASRMCGQKDHLDFVTYPSVDANDLIGTTIATQMAWIKARFDGRMTPDTCR